MKRKGVTVRWGLKEAWSEGAGRRTGTGYEVWYARDEWARNHEVLPPQPGRALSIRRLCTEGITTYRGRPRARPGKWRATEELRKIPDVEIVAAPQLSIVAFRLARPGWDTDSLNQLNRELLNRINARKRVYLSGTMLGDRFALRICVLSFRTHFGRMQDGLADIRAAVSEILAR